MTLCVIFFVKNYALILYIFSYFLHMITLFLLSAWGIGYQWNPLVAQANVGDIVEWTWTTPSWILSFTHRVEQTLNETATEPAVDGFISSKTGTANGEIYLLFLCFLLNFFSTIPIEVELVGCIVIKYVCF